MGGEIGLRIGDHSLKIGDVFVDRYNPGIIRSEIAINNASTITILRDGEEKVIPVDPRFTQILTSYDYKDAFLVAPRMPVKIGQVVQDSNADKAGLMQDDEIIAINGVRSEEHTSELQSRGHLVCRLLLEKK